MPGDFVAAPNTTGSSSTFCAHFIAKYKVLCQYLHPSMAHNHHQFHPICTAISMFCSSWLSDHPWNVLMNACLKWFTLIESFHNLQRWKARNHFDWQTETCPPGLWHACASINATSMRLTTKGAIHNNFYYSWKHIWLSDEALDSRSNCLGFDPHCWTYVHVYMYI